MHGKFFILLFFCLNLSTLVASSVCLEMTNECDFGNNFVLELFIPSGQVDDLENNAGELTETGGTGFNEDLTGTVSDITNEQSGGTFLGDNGFSFLDGLKMILGVISLLLPIPFVAFIISVGFPLWLTMLLAIGIPLLYLLAIMEFIRGSSF